MLAPHLDVPAGLKEPIKRERRTRTPSNSSRDRRADDAQLRKRPHAENQQWSKHDVDRVGEPEDAHRDRRVAGAAKNAVDQKQHHDARVPAEHHPREARSSRDDVLTRAKIRSNDSTTTPMTASVTATSGPAPASGRPPGRPRRDCSHQCVARRSRSLRSKARPRTYRRSPSRLGQSDRRDRRLAKSRDKEDVGDRKNALEHHLENHGTERRRIDRPIGPSV